MSWPENAISANIKPKDYRYWLIENHKKWSRKLNDTCDFTIKDKTGKTMKLQDARDKRICFFQTTMSYLLEKSLFANTDYISDDKKRSERLTKVNEWMGRVIWLIFDNLLEGFNINNKEGNDFSEAWNLELMKLLRSPSSQFSKEELQQIDVGLHIVSLLINKYKINFLHVDKTKIDTTWMTIVYQLWNDGKRKVDFVPIFEDIIRHNQQQLRSSANNNLQELRDIISTEGILQNVNQANNNLIG